MVRSVLLYGEALKAHETRVDVLEMRMLRLILAVTTLGRMRKDSIAGLTRLRAVDEMDRATRSRTIFGHIGDPI